MSDKAISPELPKLAANSKVDKKNVAAHFNLDYCP